MTPKLKPGKTHGFALIISLVLMALVLLLLTSLSSLVLVEASGSREAQLVERARQNALFAMRIALGELQKYSGPDQRVTAPATVSFPEREEILDLYRANAVDREGFRTFLDQSGQDRFEQELIEWWEGRNPRWIGVWDSTPDRGVPVRDQLPAFLVSGNERFPLNIGTTSYPNGYLKPDDILGDPASDESVVWIVGGVSATDSGDGVDGMDGRVKVPRIPISAGATAEKGHYAYWVGDESVKANFTLRDPYYDELNISSEPYRNRLLAPQRVGWERISAFEALFDGGGLGFGPNDPRLEKLEATSQVSLMDPLLAAVEPLPQRIHFHDLTTHSKTVLSDTRNGGLKRDLTVYFKTGAGLNGNDTIPDPADYFGDSRFGDANAGFPASLAGIPTWNDLKMWYDNEAVGGGSGLINVEEDQGPILTGIRLHFGFSRQGDEVYMHLLPVVTLWNPYDAGLNSTVYEVEVLMEVGFKDFSVATRDLADPDPLSDLDGETIPSTTFLRHRLLSRYDGSSSLLHKFRPWQPDTTIRMRFSGGFGAGETKVFSIISDQLVSNPDLQGSVGSGVIEMELAEAFDTDFPASARFPIMEILPPLPQVGDVTRFIAGSDVSWDSSTKDRVFIKNFPEIRIRAGKYQTRMNNVGLFEPGLIEGSMIAGQDRKDFAAIRDSRPEDWRRLFVWDAADPSEDFRINIEGQDDTHDKETPIIGFARLNFEPFTIQPWTLKQINQVGKFYRAFANYNLHANEIGPHPLVELNRDVNGNNNDDDFPRLEFIQTVEWQNPSLQGGGMRWDQGLTDPIAGTNSGFSLITPFFESPNRRYLGIRQLPLRLVKRPESELLSIGQLQQVNVSRYFWQPTFPIGNSEATPYVDRKAIAGITARQVDTGSGVSTVPNDSDNTALDISYLLNEALWDRYFLSGVPQSSSRANAVVAGTESLPNARIRVREKVTDGDEIRDFDEAARNLTLVGALNVNSTSVEAWKALLTAFRDLKIQGPDGIANPDDTVPVSRTLEPQQPMIDYTFTQADPGDIGAIGKLRDYTQVMSGFRYLSDAMIAELAERIVDEVRLRGPFLSLGDFVNRRLVSPDRGTSAWDDARTQAANPGYNANFMATSYDPLVGLSGINGALQRAINLSGINGGVNYPDGINQSVADLDRVLNGYPVSKYNPGIETDFFFNVFPSTHYFLDSEHIAGAPVGEVGQLMSHAAGFVTQGDILAMIGSALTARGDTFLIRSYGDAVDDATGEVESRVWLETVVQRLPEPVRDLDGDYVPDDALGRRYAIVSMRWLSREDED